METTQPYLPLLNEDHFNRAKNRILAGAEDEYARIKRTHTLTPEQDEILNECHNLIIKTLV